METGESELTGGVEPAAGADGLEGVEASVDAEGGCVGEDGESELVAGSACVPI
jgi:hypothetical protein